MKENIFPYCLLYILMPYGMNEFVTHVTQCRAAQKIEFEKSCVKAGLE
jgi:hypothetical protein